MLSILDFNKPEAEFAEHALVVRVGFVTNVTHAMIATDILP